MQAQIYSPPSHFARQRQPSLPGQRHWGGLSILARSSSTDDRGARAEPIRSSSAVAADAAARVLAYPSPPMSGSPPLPPKPSLEAGDRSKGRAYPATGYDAYDTYDAYRGTTTVAPVPGAAAAPARSHEIDYARHHHPDAAQQPHGYQHPRPQQQQQQHTPSYPPPHAARPYPPEPQERSSYPVYRRSDEAGYPPSLVPPQQQPQHPHVMTGYSPYLPQLPGPSSMQQGYPPTCLPPGPVQQLPSPIGGPSLGDPDSPKTQRKTKGHVASACVPCKKAHLRCDAQRPCSRCLSNGKENACIDVQHKKRGRPRLREDRDLGYDFSGRGLSSGGHPAEHRNMPLLYGQPPPMGSGYGVLTRRGHAPSPSYRVLKSQRADPVLPRYFERAAVGVDTGGGGGGYAVAALSAPPLLPEPAAFLTMELEIGNASSAFSEVIGRPTTTVNGLHILDVIAPAERDRVLSLQRQMQGERQRKDPQYLPPIFARRDEQRVLQAQGFGPQDLARFVLDWHEVFTFVAADGQQRTFPVRLGLAKRDSIYFIVLLLQVAVRPPPPPPPSRDPRDMRDPRDYPYDPYAYPQQQQPPPPQAAMYGQPPLVAGAYDAGRSGMVPSSHHPAPTSSAYGGPPPPQPPPPPPPAAGRPEHGVGVAGVPHPYSTPRGEPAAGFGGALSHRQREQQQQQPGGGGGVGVGGGSSGSPFYQLPPIRSQQHDAPPPPPPPPTRGDTRVNIGGLLDRSDSPRRP